MLMLVRVFHDEIKFYILRQNLHHTCFDEFQNVKWCVKQTSVLGLPSSTYLSGLFG